MQGFRLHMPGRYPQQSIEMQYLTQEALWDILVRHHAYMMAWIYRHMHTDPNLWQVG